MSDPLMQGAKELHKAGKIPGAMQLYRRVLRANPAHTEALYGLGMAEAQMGNLAEAERLMRDALTHAPRFAEAWRARAMMLMHLQRFEDAHASVERALAIRPDFAEALALRESLLAKGADAERMLAVEPRDAAGWNDRGGVLVSMKRMAEALASFDKAVALRHDYVEAICNRATLLFEMDRLETSLAGFDAALALNADIAIVWNNRGNVLTKLGRFEDALASYDRALELYPGFSEALENRELPLFELGRTSRSPAKYMRGLFDGFSCHYDDTMLNKLGYAAHRHVRALAERVRPELPQPLRIFDLGCGTGLVGEAMKDMLSGGGRLDGIDLSPRMIEAARKRGIYDRLIVGDIEMALGESDDVYDLMVSADTMTYFGDLRCVFESVVRRLKPGGFYLFASEAKAGEGWEKTKVHRYRHGESYLRAEAAQAGLEFLGAAEVTLRHEENEPVRGFAVTLRKPT